MHLDFSLSHLRFHFEPKSTLIMPARNKGNVIRGGFGSTFRRIVCHSGCREPATCQLRNVCPYVTVFHPFVPEGSERLSRNPDIPRPFVIKPPLEEKETYAAGDRLSFDMVLVGRIRDYLPYFIVTFKELCRVGLGRGRTPVELVAVESVGADGDTTPVYTLEENIVRPPRAPLGWADIAGSAGKGRIERGRQITLRFLTPTMLKVDGAVVRHPSFGTILKRLRDRINALSYFYCGAALEIDFKAFGEAADKVITRADVTRWVETRRYSRRREVPHDLSGFVGDASFEGDLGPFVPYLKLGEYVHVGKNVVFGNGWYRIVEVD
ncbi:MAG TPA: CRISPR system precrRNA processing endoribonuclease RAMP protein Cas6 [candidate division Zixibacteria bacterium]|nr:CRISPR system precrRNA processing endoribonuclease RAMP protein Cas6 [candidate division Zixibacteria bacterium]